MLNPFGCYLDWTNSTGQVKAPSSPRGLECVTTVWPDSSCRCIGGMKTLRRIRAVLKFLDTVLRWQQHIPVVVEFLINLIVDATTEPTPVAT